MNKVWLFSLAFLTYMQVEAGCPDGNYYLESQKKCATCHKSCKTCKGPYKTDCLACPD